MAVPSAKPNLLVFTLTSRSPSGASHSSWCPGVNWLISTAQTNTSILPLTRGVSNSPLERWVKYGLPSLPTTSMVPVQFVMPSAASDSKPTPR
ncbi:hypothetical protein D9M70_536070 [compost metagenome]